MIAASSGFETVLDDSDLAPSDRKKLVENAAQVKVLNPRRVREALAIGEAIAFARRVFGRGRRFEAWVAKECPFREPQASRFANVFLAFADLDCLDSFTFSRLAALYQARHDPAASEEILRIVRGGRDLTEKEMLAIRMRHRGVLVHKRARERELKALRKVFGRLLIFPRQNWAHQDLREFVQELVNHVMNEFGLNDDKLNEAALAQSISVERRRRRKQALD